MHNIKRRRVQTTRQKQGRGHRLNVRAAGMTRLGVMRCDFALSVSATLVLEFPPLS